MAMHAISSLFFLGIILGIFRLFIIVVLACFQKFSRKRIYDLSYQPFVTLLVPAYNEAVVITKTLHNLLQSSYKNLEIIMIDDGSSDDTFARAEQDF